MGLGCRDAHHVVSHAQARTASWLPSCEDIEQGLKIIGHTLHAQSRARSVVER